MKNSPKTPRTCAKRKSIGKRSSLSSPHSNTPSKISSFNFQTISSLKKKSSSTLDFISTLGLSPASNKSSAKRDLVDKNKFWLGSGSISKTPQKSKRPPVPYDRFIPNRESMDHATSQFDISHRSAKKINNSTDIAKKSYLENSDISYQEEIAKACGVALDKRILAFNIEPPKADHREQNKQNWTRPFRPPNSRLAKRKIPTVPERVLDAPGFLDDYYLNLLDWSSQNVVAIGLNKTVYIWNAETGSVQEICSTPDDDYVASLKFTGCGSYLSVGTFLGDAQIWDLDKLQKVRSMKGHVSRVGVLSWEKHLLSSGARDGSIWNHDTRIAKHKVGELISHTGEVCGLEWRADGQYLASGGNDNLVNIWDARSSVPKHTKTDHTAAVKAIAWCPWQLSLLSTGGGSNDGKINFWNTTSGVKVNTIDTGSQVTSLIWSRQYKEIFSSHGYPNNHLSIWGYPSLTKIADMAGHDMRVLHSAVSPDGQTVVTGAADENLKFWKTFENRGKSYVSENDDISSSLEKKMENMSIR